jgi:hypothetical protein
VDKKIIKRFSGNRFWDNIYKRRKFRAMCPYWNGHSFIKQRLLSELLFQKWIKRPNKSYILYWKMHPQEYYMANITWQLRNE